MIRPYLQKKLLCGVAVFAVLAMGAAHTGFAQDGTGIPSPTPIGSIEAMDDVAQDNEPVQNLLPEEDGAKRRIIRSWRCLAHQFRAAR